MEALAILTCSTSASLLTAITMMSRTQAGVVVTVALLMTRACPTVYEDRIVRPVFVRAHRRRLQRGPPTDLQQSHGCARLIGRGCDADR